MRQANRVSVESNTIVAGADHYLVVPGPTSSRSGFVAFLSTKRYDTDLSKPGPVGQVCCTPILIYAIDGIKPEQGCQVCGVVDKIQVSKCVQCNDLCFCEVCWDKWVLHAPGATGWGGKPHEKVDPTLLKRLREVLEPSRTEAEHEEELEQDRDTTWFGFDRDSSGQPSLVDHGRYATMMAESLCGRTTDRYPQFVSFIGETVTSSKYDYIPTTGDVHLYADPSSFFGNSPLLLADCEGLNGGEALPKALRRDSTMKSRSLRSITVSTSPLSNTTTRLTSVHSSHRSIVWAKSPRTRKREYTVQYLYPKILYTFSDVVVFVARNPRSFESTVLDKLVEWGANSLDKSLNQPVLPHAIIVFNASENVDEEEWESTKSTELLMATIDGAVIREPVLAQYVAEWAKRGERIKTTKQLLECYYDTITVIRIPSRGSYLLMDKQCERLMSLIKKCCAKSFATKKQLRLLANADRMQVYLQSAFDHFTRDLETPFDFVKVALHHNPVARGFEGNILRLAIFSKLTPMIASCVMLDAARQNLLGTASQLLAGAYSELCNTPLETFANSHWPCDFSSSSIAGARGRCCNVKQGHMKGHQNTNGSVIGNDFLPTWIKAIGDQLDLLLQSAYRLGQKLSRTASQIAAILHRQRMNSFYTELGDPIHFTSHAACFACLRDLPECALPCGHVLCVSCVEAYGRRTSRTTIELTRCPLHVQEPFAGGSHILTQKPHRAGARILSLDGGGVGVIVELYTLRAIQKILGPKLPIRNFFDLILGTSAGGIVALGLGTQHWSIDEAILKFKDIATKAFRPRDFNRIPFLGEFASIFRKCEVEQASTGPNILSERCLFGGQDVHNQEKSKVAVIVSPPLVQPATVIANYNRCQEDHEGFNYQFLRPDAPVKEIKIWEAARATFARPRFFKPFLKADSKEQYIDGSVKCICPAQIAYLEAQLIWKDTPVSPDILVSLGTGGNMQERKTHITRRLSRIVSKSSDSSSLKSAAAETQADSLLRPLRSKPKLLLQKSSDDANSEEMWNNFITSTLTSSEHQSSEDIRRFIRMSPALRMDTPGFDDLKHLEALEREAEEAVSQDAARVKEIAHRLIATSFFFAKSADPVRRSEGGYICSGSLCCRFQQGSSEMKGLGDFLRTCFKGSFEPYFLIEDLIEDGQHRNGNPAVAIVLTEAIIRNMRSGGYFDLKHFEIKIRKEHLATKMSLCLQTVPYASSGATALLPISGFPRQLLGEDDTHTATLATYSALLNKPTPLPERPDLTKDSTGNKSMDSSSSYVVLLNKAASLRSSDIKELPETTAPTPELPGESTEKPVAIFELGDSEGVA
ncbi:FabD/lysophospholipase-like protein [Xylariaceae sp. FL0255]|nr:FabD/lysophospholipase-like protein [Xylariaceae sp. FL0255]